jgi:hypothetical protein
MRRTTVALSVGCVLIAAIAASVALGAHSGRDRSVPKTLLLGNAQQGPSSTVGRAGAAQVFPFTSRQRGTARAIRIYIGAHNQTRTVVAGVYAYRAGRPRKRLTYGTLSHVGAGRWNTVTVRPASIRPGHRYGIAVLATGKVHLRDQSQACDGSRSELLTTNGLPVSWHGGRRQAACSISAYIPDVSPAALGASEAPAVDADGSTVVGTAGAPPVVCAKTLEPGANVQSALAATAPGHVVCLGAGDWKPQTISGLSPAAPGVTLAPSPDAIGQVNMAGITTTGTVENLTVEGINFSSTFAVHAGANHITLDYNNFQHFAKYAIELCGGCITGNPPVDDVTMSYNQIDHTFYCLRVATAGGGYTFSHNVCGPGIGDGGGEDAHYIQAEGNNDVTIDNNAFEGPADAQAIAAGAHLNVTHQYGNNLTFDNNILWQTETVGQSLLWGDDGPVHGGQANNNLILESPGQNTYSLWIDKAHDSTGVTFSNDTVINPTQYGGLLNESAGDFTAHDDLTVSGSHQAYGGFSDCNCSDNAAADPSGDVRWWLPRWDDTTWTPNDGSPWSPPPAGYYKPRGVISNITSTFGYQGTIGP